MPPHLGGGSHPQFPLGTLGQRHLCGSHAEGSSIQGAGTLQPRKRRRGARGISAYGRRRMHRRRAVGVGAFRNAHPRVELRVFPQHYSISPQRHVYLASSRVEDGFRGARKVVHTGESETGESVSTTCVITGNSMYESAVGIRKNTHKSSLPHLKIDTAETQAMEIYTVLTFLRIL